MLKRFDLNALPERLRAKILVYLNGCWNWMGSIDVHGYGQFKFEEGGRNYKAHRLVWEILVGTSPEELHHICRNKRCVNPFHLEATTRAEHPLKHRKAFCKNGHDLTLAGSTEGRARRCVICRKAYAKKRQAKSTEYARKWRAKNRKHCRKYDNDRYHADPDRKKESNRRSIARRRIPCEPNGQLRLFS